MPFNDTILNILCVEFVKSYPSFSRHELLKCNKVYNKISLYPNIHNQRFDTYFCWRTFWYFWILAITDFFFAPFLVTWVLAWLGMNDWIFILKKTTKSLNIYMNIFSQLWLYTNVDPDMELLVPFHRISKSLGIWVTVYF